MTTEHGQVAPATSGGGTAAPGDDLYFGPCLNPAGDPWDVALAEAKSGPPVDEAAIRDNLAARAQAIADKLSRGEVTHGLPSGLRFEFTRAPGPHPVDGAFLRQVRGTAPEPPPGGFMVPPGMLEGLRDAIMDAYGLPRDLWDRPVPPLTRRQRLKRKLAGWRERAARLAFRALAGHDAPEEDW